MKSIMWRSVMIVVFTAVALLLFLPSTPLSKRLPAAWVDNVPKMVLGLDLQGGMHLVLDVQQDKAVENYTQRLSGSMETSLKTKGILYTSVTRTGIDSIDVAYASEEAASAIKKLVSEEYPALSVSETKDGRIFFELKTDEIKRIKEWAATQALETIRNRIDKFGVSEPLIQRQGDNSIVVELPGLKDTERAISLIGKTAVLEFRLIDEAGDPSEAVRRGAPFGSEVVYGKNIDPATDAVTEIPYIVKKEVLLTGDLLSDARVAFDPQFNEPYVSLTFDSTGARVFARITEKNVNKRLAIMLDGNVHSAPVIREKIAGGRAQISGGFTNEEAADLAIVLRAGALPARVRAPASGVRSACSESGGANPASASAPAAGARPASSASAGARPASARVPASGTSPASWERAAASPASARAPAAGVRRSSMRTAGAAPSSARAPTAGILPTASARAGARPASARAAAAGVRPAPSASVPAAPASARAPEDGVTVIACGGASPARTSAPAAGVRLTDSSLGGLARGCLK